MGGDDCAVILLLLQMDRGGYTVILSILADGGGCTALLILSQLDGADYTVVLVLYRVNKDDCAVVLLQSQVDCIIILALSHVDKYDFSIILVLYSVIVAQSFVGGMTGYCSKWMETMVL